MKLIDYSPYRGRGTPIPVKAMRYPPIMARRLLLQGYTLTACRFGQRHRMIAKKDSP